MWVGDALLLKGVMLAAWEWRGSWPLPAWWDDMLRNVGLIRHLVWENLQGVSPDTGSWEAHDGSLAFVEISSGGYGVHQFLGIELFVITLITNSFLNSQ